MFELLVKYILPLVTPRTIAITLTPVFYPKNLNKRPSFIHSLNRLHAQTTPYLFIYLIRLFKQRREEKKQQQQQQKRTEEERNKSTHLEIGGDGREHFMWRCVDNKCGNN